MKEMLFGVVSMSYGIWQGWGNNPIIAYPIETIEKLEKELNEYRQGVIKSINEFINSPPAEFVYVVNDKDCIKLESNTRGAAINIQPMVVLTQPPRLISPSIVIGEAISLLRSSGFSEYGGMYGYTVLRKSMRFWGNASEFINWLFNSGIRISEEARNAVNEHSDSIESAEWVKEVLIGTNELMYHDAIILRIKRGVLNRLASLLKPRR